MRAIRLLQDHIVNLLNWCLFMWVLSLVFVNCSIGNRLLYQAEKLCFVQKPPTQQFPGQPRTGAVAQRISSGGHEVVVSFEVILSELSVLLDCTMWNLDT